MKRILIASIAVVLVITAYLVFFQDQLSQKVENLKLAPEKLLCQREKPTSISLNYYADEKAGWRAMFAGKNGQDFYLGFVQYSKESQEREIIEFALVDSRWEYAADLTPKENLEFRKRNTYSDEESEFLKFCFTQISEYQRKREERKRLYTPV